MTDEQEYIQDNYGHCDRQENCYWGKDNQGRWNGCLKLNWLGTKCSHWHPVKATTFEELRQHLQTELDKRQT